MIRAILSLLGGSGGIAAQIREAYAARLAAQTDEAKLAADLDIKRLENAASLAEIASRDRWGATSVGRYLVVIPFGMWYSFGMLDSTFAFEWNTLALSPQLLELTRWLVPAIIIGDVGRSIFRR